MDFSLVYGQTNTCQIFAINAGTQIPMTNSDMKET
jgi:hypothetical protein